MAEYTYDESGAVFNFFLLAVLTTLLLPATYWGLVKGRKASGPVKKQTSSSRSWFVYQVRAMNDKQAHPFYDVLKRLWTYGLAAGWALFAIVAYRAATMEIVESQESWNPWDILGVDMVRLLCCCSFRRMFGMKLFL